VADVHNEDREEHLFAYIDPGVLGFEAGAGALDRFDAGWLLERLHDIDGRLEFDLAW
jgi:hypothetical protein